MSPDFLSSDLKRDLTLSWLPEVPSSHLLDYRRFRVPIFLANQGFGFLSSWLIEVPGSNLADLPEVPILKEGFPSFPKFSGFKFKENGLLLLHPLSSGFRVSS